MAFTGFYHLKDFVGFDLGAHRDVYMVRQNQPFDCTTFICGVFNSTCKIYNLSFKISLINHPIGFFVYRKASYRSGDGLKATKKKFIIKINNRQKSQNIDQLRLINIWMINRLISEKAELPHFEKCL